jgi:hypothetical protein
MNPTEQKIFGIIRDDVCSRCPGQSEPHECDRHRRRCESAYERQAREIYLRVVKPLDLERMDFETPLSE